MCGCAPTAQGIEPVKCMLCGDLLDEALIKAGFTTHGEELQ
jgi:hypothetical protein